MTAEPSAVDGPVEKPGRADILDRQLASEQAADIGEWLAALSAGAPIKVAINRISPATWKGHNIEGQHEVVDELIDEEYLRQTWGGGKFQLVVKTLKANGQWKYRTARTVKIAGEPKIDALINRQNLGTDEAGVAHVAPAVHEVLAGKAMDVMERTLREERSRQGQQPSGPDPSLRLILDSLNARLDSSEKANRDLQQRLYDTINRPQPPSMGDRIAEKVIDGESARIQAITTQFQSERRQLEDRMAGELKDARERHRDELRDRERAHERELGSHRQSQDMALQSQKTGYEARIDGLKMEIDRLNRDLTDARARIGTLEAKKDKTVHDSVDEIIKFKGSLDALGLGGDGEDEGPWYERLAKSFFNSDKAMDVAAKVLGGAQAPPAAAPPSGMPPPGVPFQAADGNVYVIGPDGTAQLIGSAADVAAAQQQQQRRRRRRVQAAAAAPPAAGTPPAPAPGAAAPPAQPAGRPPDGKELAAAIAFIEQAIANGSDPAQFAQGARALIPAEVLEFIKTVGVDGFLAKVAELKPDSPLASQVGRNFVRTASKVLGVGAG